MATVTVSVRNFVGERGGPDTPLRFTDALPEELIGKYDPDKWKKLMGDVNSAMRRSEQESSRRCFHPCSICLCCSTFMVACVCLIWWWDCMPRWELSKEVKQLGTDAGLEIVEFYIKDEDTGFLALMKVKIP